MKIFGIHGIIFDRNRETEKALETQNSETIKIPLPEKVCLPLYDCRETVSVSQKVFVGTKIGEENKGVPVYSSVSGEVEEICEISLPFSEKCKAVVIKTDGSQTVCENLQKPEITDKTSFVKAVRDSGCVEPDGEGTFSKFEYDENSSVDTLIINGGNCEPFVTSDYRCIAEDGAKIIGGAILIKKFLGVKNVYICIDNEKSELADELKEKCGEFSDENIIVKNIQSCYPDHNEKVLVYNLLGRVVKQNQKCTDAGVCVVDIQSAAFIYDYAVSGMPLVNKRVTVGGDIVKTPCNVLVPVGISAEDILKFADTNFEFVENVVFGGAMNGKCSENLSTPLCAKDKSVLAFRKPLENNNKKEMKQVTEFANCIKCGRCHDGCAFGLYPEKILKAVEKPNKKTVSKLSKLHLEMCIDCGGCTYVCPSRINLNEKINIAREILKKGVE